MRSLLQTIYNIAELRNGFFTMRQAVEAGIPKANVVQLCSRGRLERVSRGVYRLCNYPYSANAPYWEAILWPQGNADVDVTLSHETALVFHRLTDINPSEVHISISPKTRILRDVPAYLAIHRSACTPDDVELFDGLRVTTLRRTLHDIARAGTSRAFLAQALDVARRRYLVPPDFRLSR